jgi:hypothetical protein
MEGYEMTDDMFAQDLAAQEEAARQYQPQLEVRHSLAWITVVSSHVVGMRRSKRY